MASRRRSARGRDASRVAPPPTPPTKAPMTGEEASAASQAKYNEAWAKQNKLNRARYGLDGVAAPTRRGGTGETARRKAEFNERQAARAKGAANKKKKAVNPEDTWKKTSDMVKARAEGLMTGEIQRYSPEMLKMMKDSLFQDTMGQVDQQTRALDARMAKRGMFRSGIAARTESDMRREGLRAYSRGVKDIMLKKMDAEFTDKNEGLKMAQSYVTGQQNYQLGKERNAIARSAISAQLSIAAAANKTARMGIRAANGRARAALTFQQGEAARSQTNIDLKAGPEWSPFAGGGNLRGAGNIRGIL